MHLSVSRNDRRSGHTKVFEGDHGSPSNLLMLCEVPESTPRTPDEECPRQCERWRRQVSYCSTLLLGDNGDFIQLPKKCPYVHMNVSPFTQTAAVFFTLSESQRQFKFSLVRCGAGEGNRTPATSLEGWSSTIELHPHIFPDKLRTCVGYFRTGPSRASPLQCLHSYPSILPRLRLLCNCLFETFSIITAYTPE